MFHFGKVASLCIGSVASHLGFEWGLFQHDLCSRCCFAKLIVSAAVNWISVSIIILTSINNKTMSVRGAAWIQWDQRFRWMCFLLRHLSTPSSCIFVLWLLLLLFRFFSREQRSRRSSCWTAADTRAAKNASVIKELTHERATQHDAFDVDRMPDPARGRRCLFRGEQIGRATEPSLTWRGFRAPAEAKVNLSLVKCS